MQDHIDIAAASASTATKATYGSSAVAAGVGVATSSWLGLVISAVGVFGGLLLSWYWHKKTYELKKRDGDRKHELRLLEHEADMALPHRRNRKDSA